jgi:hypothetical protein
MKATFQMTTVIAFIFAYFICGCIAHHNGVSLTGPGLSERPTTKVIIRGNVGLPGVLLKGLPSDPCSDNQGEYLAVVDPNWSGEVTPILKGYRFRPTTMRYRRVISNTEKQDYLATKIVFPISGSIGLEGVTMKGLPGLPVTGSDGCYRDLVIYGWSGRVEPNKEGYAFEPSFRRYEDVEKEYIHENYITTSNQAKTPDIHEAQQRDQAVPRPIPLSGGSTTIYHSILAPAVVIVPGTASGTGELNEIDEDLRVMSVLLQQALDGLSWSERAQDPNSKIEYQPATHVQALYLQEYGVVFSIWTQSLVPAEDLIQDLPDGDPNRHTDPVWEQAQQWLWPNMAFPDPGTQISAHKVLNPRFQARLVVSLRHASNIRHLGPNQWVIIHLAGEDLGGESARCKALPVGGRRGPAATLSIQKCYIDALASGLLDEHLFQDYVQVLVQ